MELITVVGGAN